MLHVERRPQTSLLYLSARRRLSGERQTSVVSFAKQEWILLTIWRLLVVYYAQGRMCMPTMRARVTLKGLVFIRRLFSGEKPWHYLVSVVCVCESERVHMFHRYQSICYSSKNLCSKEKRKKWQSESKKEETRLGEVGDDGLWWSERRSKGGGGMIWV